MFNLLAKKGSGLCRMFVQLHHFRITLLLTLCDITIQVTFQLDCSTLFLLLILHLFILMATLIILISIKVNYY